MTGSKPLRVLVTDADNRSALAVTRSLGRRGDFVVVAGERHPGLASASRYCSARASYPNPFRDPAGFVDAVCAAAREHAVDVVMPMTEVTTLLLTEHQQRLPEHARLPFAAAQVVSRASDKSHVLELAQQLGVPTPRTVIVQSASDASQVSIADYPVVVKPARSRVLTASGWISSGVAYANDAEELRAQLAALRPELYPVLLQERIHGPGVGVFTCYAEGQPVAWFAHKRIREKPPSGGVSVLRESAPLEPRAAQHAAKLLTGLGWRGVAMVEFKRDNRDGSLRLMEINGRFWGSLQLAIDAGVDFPALLADIAVGRPVPQLQDYRVGVRTRWLWGDVDALLAVMLKSRRKLNLPPDHPGRWRTLWDFCHFWGRDLHYEILQRDDLRPWLLETRRWLTNR
jgi:predicted ATP-grasp superfamily ATP-dependent carboligase